MADRGPFSLKRDPEGPPPLGPLTRVMRLIELTGLFLVVPALFAAWRLYAPELQAYLEEAGAPEGVVTAFRPRSIMFPTLYLFVLVCLITLLFDRSFAKGQLWRMGAVAGQLRHILLLWAPSVGVMIACVLALRPESLFGMPRNSPEIWAIIMVLYPVLSVFPQGVLYRNFFFHRYERALPGGRWTLILTAALAFGWMHIVFLNWVAPVLCFLAGVKFSYTYERSRSGAAAWFEHSIYGCAMFTVGLGWYFYGGRGT